MAKSQTNYSTNAANNLLNRAQGLTAPWTSAFGSSFGGAGARQNEIYGNLAPALNQNLTTGGYDPKQLATMRGEAQDIYQTGGYDPNQVSSIMSGYGNFAATGGMTDKQQQDFVRQATEGTTATYGALQNQAKQAQIATGGLGTAGALSQMARQGGQAQGQNTLNANVALNQLLTQNKLAGLGGETGLAGQVAAGRAGGAQMGIGLEGGVAQGATSASAIMNQLYNTTTGEITDMGQMVLSSLGLDFGSEAQAAQILAGLSQNPGMFQTGLADALAITGTAFPKGVKV